MSSTTIIGATTEALGNVRPADVSYGLREEILKRRKEVKEKTSVLRREHNRAQRERRAGRSVQRKRAHESESCRLHTTAAKLGVAGS